jgi:hypothetical protein
MVLLKQAGESDGSASSGGLSPLGSVREVVDLLSCFNTAPDSPGAASRAEASGVAVLYGPGLIVELPTGVDEVSQAMVTVTDEDFAWPVLWRLCSQNGWRMMDPDTGRTFG